MIFFLVRRKKILVTVIYYNPVIIYFYIINLIHYHYFLSITIYLLHFLQLFIKMKSMVKSIEIKALYEEKTICHVEDKFDQFTNKIK